MKRWPRTLIAVAITGLSLALTLLAEYVMPGIVPGKTVFWDTLARIFDGACVSAGIVGLIGTMARSTGARSTA